MSGRRKQTTKKHLPPPLVAGIIFFPTLAIISFFPLVNTITPPTNKAVETLTQLQTTYEKTTTTPDKLTPPANVKKTIEKNQTIFGTTNKNTCYILTLPTNTDTTPTIGPTNKTTYCN